MEPTDCRGGKASTREVESSGKRKRLRKRRKGARRNGRKGGKLARKRHEKERV